MRRFNTDNENTKQNTTHAKHNKAKNSMDDAHRIGKSLQDQQAHG